jgi:paraquat-inducible protein B
MGTALAKTLSEVSTAATDAARLFKSADAEIAELGSGLGPVLEELATTLETAEATLEAARLQLRGDSTQVYQLQSTLREVEGAAAALREFFDYLERNPEALIRGK